MSAATYFKFDVHQTVYVDALNLPAFIVERRDQGDQLYSYRVIYWAEGHREDEWLYEYELTETKS